MTTIRDTTAPAIEGELRQPGNQQSTKSETGRLVALLCISALIVTAMNVVASIYLFRAGGEIRSVERQLEKLSEFEKRIKDKLDLVNTGVQAQFDSLNQGLHVRFGEIDVGMDRFERNLATIHSRQANEQDFFGDAGLENRLSTPDHTLAEIETEEGEALATDGATKPLPRKRPATPLGSVSASFDRIELPDGKVTYRKVR
jgi:hypothetical protein